MRGSLTGAVDLFVRKKPMRAFLPPMSEFKRQSFCSLTVDGDRWNQRALNHVRNLADTSIMP